jgi:fermentation-respiration switch protein FrsA (DUF1100 family)
MLRIPLYLLIAAIVWAVAACALQRRVLFPRHAIPDPGNPEPTLKQAGIEQWHHDTPAGAVEAWYVPAPNASPANPRPAVILAHGNGELIDYNLPRAKTYTAMGLNVLMPEYRGYGRSKGSPSQQAIVSDFVAFYDRLADREEVDASRIVFHGRSLGGGVTAQLAEKRKPAALILESSFTSVPAISRTMGVPRFLVLDPFDVKAVVEDYAGPVLIIHGTEDEIIPFTHAKALHAAAPNSELVRYPVGHNEGMPEDAWTRIRTFLQQSPILPQ